MVNIGFDCAVAKEAASLKKFKLITPGFSYTLGVLKVIFRRIGTPMKIIFDDGETWEQEFTLTAIGNGKFCGGGYRAAPRADLQDGFCEVVGIKKISRLTFIKLVKSYKNGTHLENPAAMKVIKYKRVSHFKMEFPSPLPICNDGEIQGAKSIDFTVIPNGFNFVLPKGVDFKYKV
jgi:diacylglycerol kinase (ATP)